MTAPAQLRKIWITVSEQPLLAGAIIVLLTLAISVFLAILYPPLPHIHDEFSYLLAADTFMHGRLANPPHPMWVFFEAFHVNMLPTYVSKYPPMQGFALALGLLISGQAIVGVWLSLAAACVAMYWMFRGWLSPGWAFFGGLMVTLNGDLIITWGQTFWGGAMAMLGGALLYGSIVRLVKKPRLLESLLCGIGIGILALSRPYEGMVASIPAAFYLFYGLFRAKEYSWRRKFSAVILPVGLVLLLSVSFMGYYNYRTTGKVTKFAYTVNHETYSATPTFFFGELPEAPTYRHLMFKRIYIDYALGTYNSVQTFSGYTSRVFSNFKVYWRFFSPLLMTIFLLGLPFAFRERQFRFLFLSCLLFGLSLLVVVPAWPHYAAPFAAVIFLVILKGLQPIWNWEFRKKRVGSVVVATVLLLSTISSFYVGYGFNQTRLFFSNQQRGAIIKQLEARGRKHLVFVRYLQYHSLHDEWVWNDADIDGQSVVWARYMNTDANKSLIDYYSDRQVWVLAPDLKQPVILPYSR